MEWGRPVDDEPLLRRVESSGAEVAGHLATFKEETRVIRQSRTPMAAALVALLWLWTAGPARAASVINYQLTNTGGAGAPPVTQVFAYVHPAGSVGPDPVSDPNSTVSPFNVLPGSTGFNADNLISFLGDGTLNTGDPIQVLRLQFDSNGFTGAGSSLKFSLDLNPKYTGPTPTLELVPGTTGVSLAAYTPPVPVVTPPVVTTPTTGGSTSGGSAAVPEPMSIALWSAAVGFGLLRARALRRARGAVA